MRDERRLLLTILVLAIIFTFSACQKIVTGNSQGAALPSQATIPTQIPSPIIKPTADISKEKLYSSIRKVDFKNFTFPWTKNQGDGDFFTLKNGKKERIGENDTEATLQKVEYGDATNDGEEEAMLSIYPWSGGNCSCEMVFIYTLKNKTPKLLWSFDTWDKADGGFKRAYAENGKLVIELFGDDKFENGEWDFNFPKDKFSGYCCPMAYTKIRFKWNGEKFVVEGKPELYDYDWKKERNKNQ
jgi:hypothetical protein